MKKCMKRILPIIVTAILFSACSNKAKKNIGLIEDMPDEYQVKTVKPLEVPPHYNPKNYDHSGNKDTHKKKLSKAEQALLKEAK